MSEQRRMSDWLQSPLGLILISLLFGGGGALGGYRAAVEMAATTKVAAPAIDTAKLVSMDTFNGYKETMEQALGNISQNQRKIDNSLLRIEDRLYSIQTEGVPKKTREYSNVERPEETESP
jgi:hypothetical protein